MDLAQVEVLRSLEERVDPRHTALLVIDMQNDYCSPEGATGRSGRDLTATRAIIAPMRELVLAARAAEIPIIFAKYTVGPNGAGVSGPELLRRGSNFPRDEATIKGTWGHDLIPEMPYETGVDIVLEKRRPSAFIGTDLDLVLRGRGVKTLVVTGVVTHGCVESTVRDAVGLDYYVAAAQDCVASTEPEKHAAGIASMANHLRYPEGVTTSERLKGIWQTRARDM